MKQTVLGLFVHTVGPAIGGLWLAGYVAMRVGRRVVREIVG
jgi:hypothetical protein